MHGNMQGRAKKINDKLKSNSRFTLYGSEKLVVSLT